MIITAHNRRTGHTARSIDQLITLVLLTELDISVCYFCGPGHETDKLITNRLSLLEGCAWKKEPFGYRVTNANHHHINIHILRLRSWTPATLAGLRPDYCVINASIYDIITPVEFTALYNWLNTRRDIAYELGGGMISEVKNDQVD